MTVAASLVREFQTAFETSKDPELWKKLINEEADELLQAAADLLKETCDLLYVLEGYKLVVEGNEMESQKASEDIDEVIAVAAPIFGMKVLVEAFKRVHASNMSKLGDDGKPVRREDGKVMKGPNYKPPNLLDLV